jgi:histidinol-phosphate aminotransferase
MDALLNLVRPAIREMTAYSSARSLGFEGKYYLDANESPWNPFDGSYAALGVNRYPSPQPSSLVQKLANLYQVEASNLIVGRGADDAIDWIVRAFCEARLDSVIICPPTYGMYEISTRLQGGIILEVPTTREECFVPNIEKILAKLQDSTKLVFICSPNNPTGNTIPTALVKNLATALFGKCMLVVDEAYIEFSSQPSFVSELGNHPNVLILRTLSKSFGLAGARCGVAIGHPSVMSVLQKVRAPYPIAFPALEIIEKALGNANNCALRVKQTIEQRTILVKALKDLPSVKRVFPSDTNFILLQTRDATEFMNASYAAGVILRDRSRDHGLRDCVRITVGSPDENNILLSALRRLT